MAITWCAAMSDGCLLNSVAVVALPIAMVSRPNGYRVVPQWLCCYGDWVPAPFNLGFAPVK